VRDLAPSPSAATKENGLMITILIVDDHPIVRDGIRHTLEDESDFRVVAEASSGEEALERIQETDPDVVLLDIAMPGMDGFETTKRLMETKRKQPVRVVILTMYADEHYAVRLIRMGALGYVVKDSAHEELPEAIRAVQAGRRFVSASVREALALRHLDGLEENRLESLTDREFQVTRRLASGVTNREIAKELSLSVKTVDAHRLRILAKLGLRNNAELTRFAIREGIIAG